MSVTRLTPPLPRIPDPGCTVSFSAGSQSGDHTRWRVVSKNGSAKLGQLLTHFPAVREYFSSTPLLLQAYPATLPSPAEAIHVDSYGRWQTFAAALSMAAEGGLPCIITAMPLAAAHLLLTAIEAGAGVPSRILLLLGGYHCPLTLENFLRDLLRKQGASTEILHLYGVAEAEAGLLAGQRTSASRHIHFRSIDPQWICHIRRGLLTIQSRDDPERIIATDDPAEMSAEGIRLIQPSMRLDRAVYAKLDRWTNEDWSRRTGFLHPGRDGFTIQCRVKTAPDVHRGECEHYEFCHRFNQSWLDKPDWSQQVQTPAPPPQPASLIRQCNSHSLFPNR